MQVQEWDAAAAAARAEAAGLAAERRAVDAAVEELRTMLMQSVAERTRLAGEAETAEQRIAVIQRVHCCACAATIWVTGMCAFWYVCSATIGFAGMCELWVCAAVAGVTAHPGIARLHGEVSSLAEPNPCQLAMHPLRLQDADEKAAAVADVQAQAAGLAAKLSEAEAALERNTEVTARAWCCWRVVLHKLQAPPLPAVLMRHRHRPLPAVCRLYAGCWQCWIKLMYTGNVHRQIRR